MIETGRTLASAEAAPFDSGLLLARGLASIGVSAWGRDGQSDGIISRDSPVVRQQPPQTLRRQACSSPRATAS